MFKPSRYSVIASPGRRWGAVDWLIGSYAVGSGLLILACSGNIPYWPILVLLRLLLLAVLFALPKRGSGWEFPKARDNGIIRRLRRSLRFIRYLYPLVLVALFFEEVQFTVNAVSPQQPYWFEPHLYEADRAFFGAVPALVLADWESPFFDELMHAFYFSYYVMLLAGPIIAWREKGGAIGGSVEQDRQGARLSPGIGLSSTLTGMTFAFFITFSAYPFLPARGPWENPELMAQLPGFQGVFFTALIKWIIERAAVSGGCFPSAHVSGTWGLVMGLGVNHRRTGWVFAVVTAGMSFACVYTRYHHGVDVLAGVPIGLLGGWLGAKVA